MKLRIVFMGTPQFAVGILEAILKAGFEVAAVVTAPDKPAGRGQQVKFSAVKEYALEHQLPILQPANLKDPQFLSDLKKIEANVFVVVAFRMLPEAVWKMPTLGTFNLHASLLPQYRGAAPINWAIINGESKTGVTTFFIDDKIDTGAIILQRETAIDNDELLGELHDKLMILGQEATTATLSLLQENRATSTLQQYTPLLSHAPKLTRENTRINWEQDAQKIHNHIRGLSPFPAAWTNLDSQPFKIYESALTDTACSEKPGVIKTTKKSILVAAQDFWLEVKTLQPPGKKRMSAPEILNGKLITDGSKFE
jgi:methionyl-tRNA formyltransferase